MEDPISDLEKMSLSDKDVRKLVKGGTNLIKYSDLSRYKSIDHLLGKRGSCVILYETRSDYGHWTALYKMKGGGIFFFDSYGLAPDSEQSFIPEKWKKKLRAEVPVLTFMLLNSPYKKFQYNKTKLQKQSNGISTCGRHVAVKLNHRDMDHEKYVRVLKSQPEDPDYSVTLLTANYPKH
jgi:hypothetical protein